MFDTTKKKTLEGPLLTCAQEFYSTGDSFLLRGHRSFEMRWEDKS